jgi:hypothetical protein
MSRSLVRPLPGSTVECLLDYLIEQSISGNNLSASLLNAIQALNDNELAKVYDANGDLFGIHYLFDATTGALISWEFYNADGTVGVPVAPITWAYEMTETPGFSIQTGAGTVAAGKKGVSFFNSGDGDATVLTVTLSAGLSISFSAQPGNVLAAIAYDATGTSLLITTTE